MDRRAGYHAFAGSGLRVTTIRDGEVVARLEL
jgi:hypothetical protein